MLIHKTNQKILIILSTGFGSAAMINEIFLIHNSIGLSLLFNLSAVFFIYLHYRSASENNKKKFSRHYLFYAFILYLLLLLSLLFINGEFSRNLVSSGSIFSYASSHYNVIPFHTIMLYINGYKKGVLLCSELLVNLFGNLAAFMPIGFFLPRLFYKLNKLWIFLLVTTAFIIGIEIMQLILRTGVCDIDDLILNLFGALLIYLTARKKSVQK